MCLNSETVGCICSTTTYRNLLLPFFILAPSPSILWNALQSLTGQRNPVFQRSFWKNHHEGIDLLRQRTNCFTATWQLNSTIFAGMVCGVTHCLDVSGERHRLPDIKPNANGAEVKAPHFHCISTKRLVTERQGSEEHLSSAGIQLLQLIPLPPHLYCFSFPATWDASVLHWIRQEGD